MQLLVLFLHLIFQHTGNCTYMCTGQIDDVDEVPQAGAVRGRVVVAKDVQALPAACSGLGDVRHQVVGDSARKLSDQC